ncbi:MAG: ATP-binding cassette domain-containing protein, partial [SAR324 cluster bacterium]|nr:ATP-binding cassette domain-containing protein [SAR324 cluster bacterium]
MEIRLEGLKKSFKDADHQLVVIEDLNAIFRSQASIAIVGKSGVGKSTLLNLLGGLERPDEGRIFFGDLELSSLDQDSLALFRGAHVGFVFQFHQLLSE